MSSGQGSPYGKKTTVYSYGLKVCLTYPIIVSVTRSDYSMIPLYYTQMCLLHHEVKPSVSLQSSRLGSDVVSMLQSSYNSAYLVYSSFIEAL